MSDQRCEACYHTPLPCMGGHAGRMAEAPPETAAESCGQCECCDAWRATQGKALADVARLTTERDRMQYRTRCILNADSPSYPPELDEYRQCGCRTCAMHYEGEIRAQVWAEAIAVVERMPQASLPDTYSEDPDIISRSEVLAALRAKQKEEPK